VPDSVAGYFCLVTVVTPKGEGSPGDASIDLSTVPGLQTERPLDSLRLP
jgi:hypothetical protein